ncbi:M23 family metallopeptidase [Streptomyces fulvoviolaceus]|uniref:M23 family metallopeptidase n=1 Tax=Streptomyces fulvoviolaceus TaxID=285535 RepID=UPI0004CBE7E2|nr:peptidoglycan DD-metalloendopeptidase family protein [Streptomyces fulvoviolaceus]MCT9081667.1 peptidoglycan DD-metalloendopeptidase family protein [Streptomyces fulvoviolaceus]
MTTPAPASDAASAHYAQYGNQEAQYGDFTTYGNYDATASFEADPLFGNMAGESTGTYDNSAWSTGSHQTLNYDMYAAQHHAAYDTGAYDTTAWTGHHQQLSAIPPQATGNDTSGQWDASAWTQPNQSAGPADQTQHWEWGTQAFDTGAYDATQWNSDSGATATFEQVGYEETHSYGESHGTSAYDEPASHEGEMPALDLTEADAHAPLLDDQEDIAPAPAPTPAPGSRVAARNAGRSRRRTPPKRSALLTIAVPSACVMGVAGIAAASVGTMTGDSKDTSTTASDATSVKPSAANNKLDTQLESLSAGADDFADRASRTQERIDLKAQQAAERQKAKEEAARKERLRPKFALPVTQKGLSAYYGQAGINWMSVHTGIDFPVAYGTTVMAATDGTVRTEWNSSYGNMMVVTAKDGTETWYCHLSSYRVASGTTVKAGDPIAYSGNSGNSTGPHLHFEVHPAGGSAIDPLPWLRSHGLDPT